MAPNLNIKLILIGLLALVIYGMGQQQSAYGGTSDVSLSDRAFYSLNFHQPIKGISS